MTNTLSSSLPNNDCVHSKQISSLILPSSAVVNRRSRSNGSNHENARYLHNEAKTNYASSSSSSMSSLSLSSSNVNVRRSLLSDDLDDAFASLTLPSDIPTTPKPSSRSHMSNKSTNTACSRNHQARHCLHCSSSHLFHDRPGPIEIELKAVIHCSNRCRSKAMPLQTVLDKLGDNVRIAAINELRRQNAIIRLSERTNHHSSSAAQSG